MVTLLRSSGPRTTFHLEPASSVLAHLSRRSAGKKTRRMSRYRVGHGTCAAAPSHHGDQIRSVGKRPVRHIMVPFARRRSHASSLKAGSSLSWIILPAFALSESAVVPPEPALQEALCRAGIVLKALTSAPSRQPFPAPRGTSARRIPSAGSSPCRRKSPHASGLRELDSHPVPSSPASGLTATTVSSSSSSNPNPELLAQSKYSY